MKLKRKNRSILFRGMVLGVAMAFTVLCFPVNELKASAATMNDYTDYTFMTVGTRNERVLTTVNKGGVYEVANGYIGGNKNFVVGNTAADTTLDSGKGVTLKSSRITVKYSSDVIGEVVNGTAVNAKGESVSDGVVTIKDGKVAFEANKVGAYTVTYSYEYEVGGKRYTNSYDMTVTSEITDADINFGDNEKVFLPSILDLKLAEKSEGVYKDMYIPMPEIVDDEGETVDTSSENEKFEFITSRNDIGNKEKQVLIEVSASTNSTKVAVSGNAEDGFYVAGSVFADAQYGAGKYTVTYSYYEGGQFVASTTKVSQVYAKDDAHYKDYALKLQLASDFVDNGQTGVETTLPSAKGVTADSSDPKNEAVDIYYTVTVYYKTSTGSYSVIDAAKYNASVKEGEDKIVNEDGTLVNPTKFKPLDDGYYSFVYEAYDYYYDAEAGKDASVNKNHYYKTDLGRYEYKNIKDEKAPTPVVYEATKDGSLDDVDASSKMSTRARPESVVIYAIGIDDNVSKAGDEGVVLTRKIMTDETVSKITLNSTDANNGYSDRNLVFNYKGRDGLKTNNYLLRKAMEKAGTADTEAATLAYLAENKYMIVVDNANYKTIYETFKDAGVFDEGVTEENALDWFKGETATTKGFAYIDCDQTFGASAATTGGMGVGQYYIHYVATDAAGNQTDIYKRLYIRDVEDIESPNITFSTSLADSYLPNAKVTFNAPTASDNIDENMSLTVMYRYLDKDGNVIEVKDKEDVKISDKHISELWSDLGTEENIGNPVRDDNGTLITEKYKNYHKDENDGYVDITDTSVNSYTIDLSEVEGAAKLQIIAYTYDDFGNAMLYGQTIDINNVQDNFPPQLKGVNSVEGAFNNKFEQGAVIALPKVTVADDAVGYMTYDVKVDYIEEGERYARSVRESTADRTNQEGAGIFTVNAGEFVAAKDGNYQVSVAVKDANNNTIVVFTNYEVSPRATVQKPVINSTLTSQEIELDDRKTIEIPQPTVNFELGNSVTYDEYKANSYATDKTYVIRGINADGKATNWTTNDRYATNGTFTPNAKGQYEIKYSVKLEAYDKTKFTYHESSVEWDSNDMPIYNVGGYYTNTTLGDSVKITFGANGEHRFTNGTKYYIVKQEDGVVKFYEADEEFNQGEETQQNLVTGLTGFSGIDFDQWFKDLRVYNLESEIYTITVNDTKGPKLTNYDYSDQEFMSVEDFKANGIKVYGIEATDVSGIDSSKSEIRLSWKRANGTAAGDTGSRTYRAEGALKDNVYTSSSSNLDGTYTITYDVYDNNGNRTTSSYTISVGDNEDPKIVFPEDFVKTTYTLKDKLVIDLDPTKVVVTDNKPMPADAKPRVKLVNTSKNNEEVKYTEEGTKIIFDSFEEYGEGTYKLTIEVEDAVGRVTTEEFEFSVATKTKNSTETYKVVGTVLIVISVLVLAGVIVYFIVSKVKLDKELKK